MLDSKITLSLYTFRNFQEEQIQIRLNLVIALAIAQIAFLSGINAIEQAVSQHINI